MTARLCRRFKRNLFRIEMRQRRQLGERRAEATMVSRLSAQPSGHWEKLSRRAIFPNVPVLGEEADFEALNCLPALNLIRSTKHHLSTEPAFLPSIYVKA